MVSPQPEPPRLLVIAWVYLLYPQLASQAPSLPDSWPRKAAWPVTFLLGGSLAIPQLLCFLPLDDLALAPGFCFSMTHGSLRAMGVEPVSTALTHRADGVPATRRPGQRGLLRAPGLRGADCYGTKRMTRNGEVSDPASHSVV